MIRLNGDNAADEEQHYKHVDAGAEIAHYQRGYHFLTAGLVVERTGEPTEKHRYRKRYQHTEQEAAKAADIVIADKDYGKLSGDSADDYTEVKPQAGDYRDYKGQHQESVAVEAVAQLREEPVEGNALREREAQYNEYPEDYGNDIVQHKIAEVELTLVLFYQI